MKLIVNPPTPWPNWQAPVGTEKRILPGGAGPLAGWLIAKGSSGGGCSAHRAEYPRIREFACSRAPHLGCVLSPCDLCAKTADPSLTHLFARDQQNDRTHNYGQKRPMGPPTLVSDGDPSISNLWFMGSIYLKRSRRSRRTHCREIGHHCRQPCCTTCTRPSRRRARREMAEDKDPREHTKRQSTARPPRGGFCGARWTVDSKNLKSRRLKSSGNHF